MQFSITAALALASAVSAIPMKRADIDADILQYALTLEHLENAFYKLAIKTFTPADFAAAGFDATYYNDLKYVTHDEQGHVEYLTAGLQAAGADPVAACEYDFGFSTPKEFVSLASVIEGVGVSAYLGAAADITSKAYLTAAGSILVTEALHQSLQRSAIGEIPPANVFGTPMGLNAVYTIAASFITSCPSTNVALPVSAYPTLTLDSGEPTAPNATINLTPKSTPSGTFYATFVSGLDILPVPAAVSGKFISAVVPVGVSGQSYVFLTSDNSGNLTDASIIAGPAIIESTPDAPTFSFAVTK